MSYVADKVKDSAQDAMKLEKECKEMQDEINNSQKKIKEIRDFIAKQKGSCSPKDIDDDSVQKYVVDVFKKQHLTTKVSKPRTTPANMKKMNQGRDKFYKDYRIAQTEAKAQGITLTWDQYRANRKKGLS